MDYTVPTWRFWTKMMTNSICLPLIIEQSSAIPENSTMGMNTYPEHRGKQRSFYSLSIYFNSFMLDMALGTHKYI